MQLLFYYYILKHATVCIVRHKSEPDFPHCPQKTTCESMYQKLAVALRRHLLGKTGAGPAESWTLGRFQQSVKGVKREQMI